MYCSEGEWIGKYPVCSSRPSQGEANLVRFGTTINWESCWLTFGKISEAAARPSCNPEDAKSCEQLCFLDDAAGAPMCECYSGYTLREDDQTCEDIDECADDNGGCEHLCINKPGTFMCDCRKGYQTLGTYCMDVNECLLNNGHGPCQDKCR